MISIDSIFSDEERLNRWRVIKVIHQETGKSWDMPMHIFEIYVDDTQIIDGEVID
jgi:hypothetical protein